MNALVLFLLGVIAGCSAELDPRCAWGQSYWCSGLSAAKSCGAIEHCKSTVWKNQQLKQDARDSCLFCKTIVDDVKRYIQHGKTEAEIAHFLSSACGIIPDATSAAKCKEIADTLITELIQLATSDVDPQMICSLLGVCTGVEDNVQHSPVVKSEQAQPVALAQTSAEKELAPLAVIDVKDEPLCGDCKKFFKDIQDMIIANKTESQVEQLIYQEVCAQLGSLENECKTLVHEFLPEIMDILSKYYDPTMICQSLGVCAAKNSQVDKYPLLFAKLRKLPQLYKAVDKENSAATCLICKTIITELQMLGRDPAIQAEIKDLIKTRFCSLMDSMKVVCIMVIEQYSRELFELMSTVLEPTTRCHSLGFCDAVATKPEKIVPAMALTPAKYPVSGANAAEKDPSTECILCQYAVREIQQMISTNATEEEIMQALEKACTYLPESYVQTCKQFVDTYGKMVIDMLINKIDPEKVCIQLGLCTGSERFPKINIPVFKLSKTSVGTSDPGPICMVCQLVVTEVKAMIGDNATEAEIMQALEKACAMLPDKYSKQCKDFVDKYGPMVIDLLIKDIDPEQVCTQLGLCSTPKNAVNGKNLPPIQVSYPKVGNGEACAVCETIIQYLEALLEQGSTMEQIEALLGKLCGYLPPSMVNQCESIIKQYGDLIIHYVSTLASPKEVCRLIHVCDNKVSPAAAAAPGIALQAASNRIASDSNAGPGIELEHLEVPKLEIKQKAPLLGVNECTWGPYHICSSREIAVKCNKLEYCEKVWSSNQP